MRFVLIFILVSLLVAGCSRDAKLREQIAGKWGKFGESSEMTFDLDGSFHFRASYVSTNGILSITNATLKWASDGTWDVKDGFLICKITNSTSENTIERPSIGDISRSRITFVDAHNLCYTNQRVGMSWER
jgi:hypothetical protein